MNWKTIALSLLGLLAGINLTLFLGLRLSAATGEPVTSGPVSSPSSTRPKEIVGFLPYWLVGSLGKDYSGDITTLAYFGLTVGPDGHLVKLTAPDQAEPGWYDLKSGLLDDVFAQARSKNIKLSLVIFSGVESAINQLISDPINNADTLMADVAPIMQHYGFTDLNLDVESVTTASESARLNFSRFADKIKSNLVKQNLGTLTVDSSPIDLIQPHLIDPAQVSATSDYFILMAYDFHHPNSSVTGPVAPVGGFGIDAEYDTEAAVKEALRIMPAEKIVLGIPLYGYEWEAISGQPRSAIIPTTGITASNQRAEQLAASCTTCIAGWDNEAQEAYLVFKDNQTGTFHQIFYPTATSSSAKVQLVNRYQIGGLALWALGYDGSTILQPIEQYKQSIFR